ncbi:ECF transporter S component [Peribacillus loiseleuriae]|uniref:ECF transporter S component n=1 Tax=Peribacillus loiseleuriae TaxID=1679170 RepID=UPI003D023AE3
MNVKQMSVLAIFIALSVAGAFIKIPGVIGSVALDSFPSLLAACLIGPVAGAVVGGLGHLISAIIGGMLLGPLHFIIMLEMALLAWTFGILYRRDKRVGAALLFFIGNACISPLPFIFIISWSFFVALIPSLAIATAINLGVALILLPRLTPILQKMIMNKGTKE